MYQIKDRVKKCKKQLDKLHINMAKYCKYFELADTETLFTQKS
jgi:hypothetical protein